MLLNKALSVIIVNYKSEQFLPECIASVYATILPSTESEIIVINNDSADISGITKNKNGLVLVDHKKNVGFGAAANIGAKRAQGDLLLFLNPDSRICSRNIDEVVTFFKKNPKTAAVGSRVVSESGVVQEWTGGKEASLYDLMRNNLGVPKSRRIWESEVPMLSDWVAGTALFVRRDCFQESGGFDENFFMYFEDMDLCKRFREKKQDVFYYPHFCVEHLGGKSYADKTKQKKDYYQSQEYYFKKHRNFIEAGIIKFLRRMFFS